MPQGEKHNVGCYPEDKAKLVAAAKGQRLTMPELMSVLTEALPLILGEQPTIEDRKAAMKSRLAPSGGGVQARSTRSLPRGTPEEHSGNGLAAVQ